MLFEDKLYDFKVEKDFSDKTPKNTTHQEIF